MRTTTSTSCSRVALLLMGQSFRKPPPPPLASCWLVCLGRKAEIGWLAGWLKEPLGMQVSCWQQCHLHLALANSWVNWPILRGSPKSFLLFVALGASQQFSVPLYSVGGSHLFRGLCVRHRQLLDPSGILPDPAGLNHSLACCVKLSLLPFGTNPVCFQSP